MRIRRLIDEQALAAALEASRNDVLPLVFEDSDRPWIESILGPEIGALQPEQESGNVPVVLPARCSSDFVLGPLTGSVGALAARYAALTDRRVVLEDACRIVEKLPFSAPNSLTWFCPLDECEISQPVRSIRDGFRRRYGHEARLGILTAENLTVLTVMLAKQLLVSPRTAPVDLTILQNIENTASPIAAATNLPVESTSGRVLQELGKARGVVIIQGHSRPHCGRLLFADGEFGVCGLRSAGADGRCVDGVVCHFSERPRFAAQEFRAARVYYDGCSTARVGGSRTGVFGLPREAMLSHAVIRSAAREFIGNMHACTFGSADVYWLLGLSALGYSPAECVQVMDYARALAGREVVTSCVYFGDAVNHSWPCGDAVTGGVTETGTEVQVYWPTMGSVFAAKLPGRLWAELTSEDLAEVEVPHETNLQVSVVPDPWSDFSILLAVPRTSNVDDTTLSITLRKSNARSNGNAGRKVAEAIDNIRWLASLPAFKATLSGAESTLEEKLIAIRRIGHEREDYSRVRTLARIAHGADGLESHQFDKLLIECALLRSRTRWELLEEYESRSRADHSPEPDACGNCGAATLVARRTDMVHPKIIRTTRTCSCCGIIADMPDWPLVIKLDPSSVHWAGRTLRGIVAIYNSGPDSRELAAGASLVGAGEIVDGSSAQFRGTAPTGREIRFEFAVTHRRLATGTMRFRTFVASRGALGFVGGILLVRPATAQDRHVRAT